MNNLYEEDIQAEILRAEKLMSRGQKIGLEGNINRAIQLFIKALDIFLDTGSYLRISEIFNTLVSFVTSETHLLLIIENIHNTIETVEHLDIPEELANLKQSLANLHYKNSDFLNAGNLFIEVAQMLSEIDADFFQQTSGMLLLRAGECFEKMGRMERAENLIMEAIQMFGSTIFDYRDHMQQISIHLKKKYELLIDDIKEVASFYRNLELELENLPEDNVSFRNLKNNGNARLIHIMSEFNLIKMMCFRYLKDEENVINQAKKSVKDLSYAISIIKEELIDRYYSSADLHRLTFGLFLLQIFQEFADYQVEDPIDLVLRGIPQEIKKIIQKMRFYSFTEQMLELNLGGCIDLFEEIPLSQVLEPFRSFIIKAIKL